MREKENAFELDVDQLVKLLLGRLSEQCIGANTGIIDKKVKIVSVPYALKRLLYRFYEGWKGLYIGCVKL